MRIRGAFHEAWLLGRVFTSWGWGCEYWARVLKCVCGRDGPSYEGVGSREGGERGG
jgi:hypothetical protein